MLAPIDLTVLVCLVATATCPATGRVWAKPGWIADRLRLTDGLVRRSLDTIDQCGIAHVFTVRSDLYGLELGPVFVRSAEAPDNLPVEPPG